MNKAYWDLFWTTGMPEAWLMSRGERDALSAGTLSGGAQGLPALLSETSLPPVSSPPGNPRNLY